MKKYCFGIDVGGTTVKMGLFTTEGELLDKWEIPTRKEDGGAYILNDVAASVEAKLAEKNIAKDDVAGAGIGVPGPTLDTGYVSICVNLGWKDKNPANELSELLSIPVKAGNDANVAALGEMWKGGGEGYLDVVLLTLGTGVGGGIIINGEIAPSHRGVGGELGHITVNPDEEATCNCGNHGCLEQYASATGVVRIAKKLLAASKEESSLRTLETVTAKDVFDAAKAGDHLAVEAVEVLGKYLGLVVANVALTVDPDVFVIGGGVSKAGQVLIDVITKYYHKFAKIIGDNKAKVVLAKLGNDAGIYGAARMVLK
ncbi:putative glucokinase [Clostridiales bacterium KLE1615]|nr:putative glucokinase [Clostridiales bacterium KLE1615]